MQSRPVVVTLVILLLGESCGDERTQDAGETLTVQEPARPGDSGKETLPEILGPPVTDDDLSRLLRACQLKASSGSELTDSQILERVGLSKKHWGKVRLLVVIQPHLMVLEEYEATQRRWPAYPPEEVDSQDARARAWLPKFEPHMELLRGWRDLGD